MMMPSIFRDNLFDSFMEDFAFPSFPDIDRTLYGKHARNLMKTDVKETEGGYEVDIDLPGFKKDEIQMELVNGNLTVSAAKGLDKDEKDEKGTYVRRERYAGSMSRSFYVGEHVTEEDRRTILMRYLDLYDPADDNTQWFERIKALADEVGYASNMKDYKKNPEAFRGNVGDVSMVIRVAVTGRQNSPDMYEVMGILGKEKVAGRLKKALA